MKKKLVWVCIIGMILIFTGCSGKNQIEKATENMLQDVDGKDGKGLAGYSQSGDADVAPSESVSPSAGLSSITEAENLIWRAFSFDTEAINPKVETCDDLTSISYDITPTDFFVVEFMEESTYPSTLYHFCHLGEDEGFNLAEESEDYFRDEMIEASTEFLKNVYGIECTDADIHAYGYANKIAVQLEISSDEIFQVKFYYKDTKPVGVQFSSSGFERMMEANQAKQYF